MRHRIYFFSLIIPLVLFSFVVKSQIPTFVPEKDSTVNIDGLKLSKKVKKAFKNELKDFRRIPTTKTLVKYGVSLKINTIDSHALAGVRNEEFVLQSAEFFMNIHEVTNSEYRAFVKAIKNSMIKAGTYDTLAVNHPVWFTSNNFQKLNIQINNELWLDELKLDFMEPMMKYYFTHSIYDNYPVVGITYEQCLAFIEWKNEQFSKKLKSLGFDKPWGKFRLPTRNQWMVAGGSNPNSRWNDSGLHRKKYPWDGISLHDEESGLYKANFGEIRDLNGLFIKSHAADGHMCTAPVKQYAPNDFGLYDLGGNVSEWTTSTVNYDSLLLKYNSFYQLSSFNGDTIFHLEINKPHPNWEAIDSLVHIRKSSDIKFVHHSNKNENRSLKDYVYFTKIAKPLEVHNLELLKKNKVQNIVKGGNWWHGPTYMQLASQQAYYKKEASVTVGMRLALELDPKALALLGKEFGVYRSK